MVKLLHREGIEVILDVVYNHTAEQDRTGATLSWRGLDQRAYYRLDERGRDIDVTGCGNTLDLRHPVVCRMVLDSLRYWVQEFHVDGFRFDLAVALGRGRGDEFDPDHPFLVALRTDPVLSRVKLIAEPWDLGMHGWRTGQFPPPFMEWNDRFRDAVRRFWISDVRAQAHGQHSARPAGPRDPARRVARPVRPPRPGARPHRSTSSPPTTASRWPTSRRTTTSTTRRTARTTATAATATPRGTTASRARPTTRRRSRARARTIRNLLGTLLLSTGVPMLNAGDEMGRTQGGNNNAYCQDNETTLARLGPRALAGRPPRDDPAPGPGAPGAAGAAPAGLGARPPGARRRQPRHGVVRRRRHRHGQPLGPPGHPGRADVRRRGLDGRRVGAPRGQRRAPTSTR